MDYSKTVHLPQTKFPMRANLVLREPETLKLWAERQIFAKMAGRKAEQTFILHDGPPYANGHIHLGTAFNKILKDIVVRSQMGLGKKVPFRPGWDCHGMPIEHEILKKNKQKKKDVAIVPFRKEAAKFARKFVEIQKKEFQRLGIYADWDNSYLTLNPGYEADEVRIFAQLALDGYIYRGKRPIYWCPVCETALAEAEIEYQDLTTDSICVLFPIIEDPEGIFAETEKPCFLVWTTTPWTLPANVALIFNPGLNYRLVELEGKEMVLAEDRIPGVAEQTGKEIKPKGPAIKGQELTKIVASHPFLDRKVSVTLAGFVSAEDGTGIVHCAPGHGEEDFLVGKEYNLPVLSPVDEAGRFTAEVPEWQGLSVWEANPKIIKKLEDSGNLVSAGQATHSYPICWRCKGPVIFRATEQWFLNVSHKDLRHRLLSSIDKVRFIPPESKRRLSGMLESRPDWCLSRQRHWGVPIPILTCRKCGKPIIEEKVFNQIAEIFGKEGSDVWFEKEAEYFLSPGKTCSCGGTGFVKEKDIIDVWFDSGVSWAAVLKEEGSFPADLYLEGSDQHRGWFQTSLITATADRNTPPFRAVLTHGFLVDESSRKMSKSLGNVITPEDALKEFGADILRLWAASQDYRQDIQASHNVLSQVAGQYRTMRNTMRFVLGNLFDFDPTKNSGSKEAALQEAVLLNKEALLPVDRWTLAEAEHLGEEVIDSYREFAFYRAIASLYDFCNLSLSSFYLDILKDRLYTYPKNSAERRSAQTALYYIGRLLLSLAAPVLVFTSEEAWHLFPKREDDPESIHLLPFENMSQFKDESLRKTFDDFFNFRRVALKEIEEVRTKGLVGSSLGAKVNISATGPVFEALSLLKPYLKELLIVSEVELGENPGEGETKVLVSPTKLPKCPRCWVHSGQIGENKEFPDLCPKCVTALGGIK